MFYYHLCFVGEEAEARKGRAQGLTSTMLCLWLRSRLFLLGGDHRVVTGTIHLAIWLLAESTKHL